jgi:hypothetical protein
MGAEADRAGVLDASYLHDTRPVTEPGALSAFPLL